MLLVGRALRDAKGLISLWLLNDDGRIGELLGRAGDIRV